MLFALLLGALAFLQRRIAWGTGWVWPVPSYKSKDGITYPAVITDGIGTPRGPGIHKGVDVMFKRRARSDRPEFKAGTSDGTPLFFAPPGALVVAAKDGVVWFAGKTSRGYAVVIDHGKPFATFYTHLAAPAGVLAGDHASGRSALTGKPTHVKAGDVIGIMGFDPLDKQKLRHLHFEVWHGGPSTHAVDPEPAMRAWSRVPWTFDA